MAAIGYKNMDGEINFRCGGSLISEFFVLSAAHCTRSVLKPYLVRMGVLTLSNATSDNDYLIDRVIQHPMYSYRMKKNDISLLKLARKVHQMKNIRPACIQFDDNYSNEVQFVSYLINIMLSYCK